MKIITAEERLKEKHYPKVLIAGPSGIGKTSLLKTLRDPTRVLFVDMESGDLAVQEVKCDTIRPETWPEMRNLACFLAGPDLSLPDTVPYSAKHYAAMVERYGDSIDIAKYDIIFVDSITVAARLCLRWCMQQPEAWSEKKDKPDTLGGYGLLGREMIAWLSRLQHMRTKAVVFVAILENVKDDRNRIVWDIQMEGAKTGRELPGIIDQVIGMTMIQHPLGDDRPEDEPEFVRAFLCTADANDLTGFMPKDRSSKLAAYERPDLGALLYKLTAPAPTA